MNTITFDQLPQAVSLLIGKVDAIAQKLATKEDLPSDLAQWFDINGLCSYHPERPAKQTVYQWLSAGKIPCHKKGKKVYFLKSEIDSWLAEGKRNTRLELASHVDTFLSSQ